MKIDKENLWVSSDFHFGHKNIVKGVSEWGDPSRCRDFSTVEEMNEAIIESINSTVPADGILFHLGDWSFGGYENIEKFRRLIKCKNIYHCYGNHDHHIQRNPLTLQPLFKECFYYKEIYVGKKLAVLSHYAFRVWNRSHKGSYHLYGHSHGSLPPIGRSLDVGWDVWKRPLAWSEIEIILNKQPVHFVDHHSAETN